MVLLDGELWLLYEVNNLITMAIVMMGYDGEKAAEMYIKTLWLYGQLVQILGFDLTQLLIDSIYTIEDILNDDFLYMGLSIIEDYQHFTETLERMVSEHGAEIFDFDIYEELLALEENELSPNLIYLDELLDGLISANYQVLYQWANHSYDTLYWSSNTSIDRRLNDLGEHLRFGEEVTREDISSVIEALISFYLQELEFNFYEIMEIAEITIDDLIEMMWVLCADSPEKEWNIRSERELWLLHAINGIINDIEWESGRVGKEYAANILRFYWMYAEIYKILGYELSDNLIDIFYILDSILSKDIELLLVSDYTKFLETLEQLISKYGTEIFEFNFYEVLDDFPDHIVFTYLDELLDGLITENIESLSQWISNTSSAWWSNRPLYRLYSDFILINEDYLERKYSFDVNQGMHYEIYIENVTAMINIFYENRSEFTTEFQYYVRNYINRIVKIPPGGRFTVQLNLSDLLDDYSWHSVEIYMYSPDGNLVNGQFSFRLTEHPLGHIY